MKTIWKKTCFWRTDMYLGDLTKHDHFEKYYFKNDTLKQAINDLVEYGSDNKCFHSVLIAGDAGSGKTSLINYVVQENLLPKAHVIVLELDHNTNNSLIIPFLIQEIEKYFVTLSEKIPEAGTLFAYYKRDVEKKTKEEKLIYLLKSHNELSLIDSIRDNESYKILTVVIDQIDLASVSVLEKNIKAIFGLLDSSKYTLKILCARHITIKMCRTRVNSLFATTFRRQIEIFPANIKTILEYRVNDCATTPDVSRKIFFNIFNDNVLKFLIVLNSGNIRKTLEVIEKILSRTNPEDMNSTIKFIMYLIKENYITRLNELEYIFGEIKLPLYFIVFRTLFYYKKIDSKFLKLISRSMVKSGIDERFLSSVTSTSIKECIKYLLDQNLIMESDYQKNQLDITHKGILIDEFMRNKDLALLFKFSNNSFKRYIVDENVIADF